MPASVTWTLGSVNVCAVAPAIVAPFTSHWKLSCPVPDAPTVKLAEGPTVAVLL